MTNEISYLLQMGLSNGGLSDSYRSSTLRADQTSARLVRIVQEIGLVEELLQTGDIVTPGFGVFSNFDDDNYVEIGSFVAAVFYPFIKLFPGEQSLCRVGVTAAQLYAKANTAVVSLFFIMYDS